MVLDRGFAVTDEGGVTHIGLLSETLRKRRPERRAYFAFDVLRLGRHDLHPCLIGDRKALHLGDVIVAPAATSLTAPCASVRG